MNNKKFNIEPIPLVLLLFGIGMAPASYAVDLMAVDGVWSPDGGTTQIPMWGFATDAGACPGAPVNWDVGPQLDESDLVAGNLTINLRNCLSDPVSIVIPGQPATFNPVTITDPQGRQRVVAFNNEAAANGGTMSYTWNGVKPGTYLYQSGSHPAKQVQMGLYGALVTGSYPGTSADVTLLYSEIDPVLHNPPTAATPLNYHPRHYLVNGSVASPALSAGDTNQPTVLRMLNAGLDFHVPALNGGYMSLVAEDGNPYPFARQQYSVNLAAGKTIDALWQPVLAGDHVIYDRRGNGMVASLTVSNLATLIANADSYSVDEDMSLTVAAIGVLGNDTGALLNPLTVPPASSILVSTTSAGLLVLNADGSFDYTPSPDFSGTDIFTYKAREASFLGDLFSNVASVTITVNPVNDMPVADPNGPYQAIVNTPITLDGSGSSDVDDDALTYAWAFGDTNTGTGEMPSHTYTATGTYTVDLVVNDGTVDSTLVSTTVEVVDVVNSAPVAVADTTFTLRNGTRFINLTDNDSDVDGNLKDGFGNVPAGQITITTGTITTREGTVTVLTNGVNYTPAWNFRGTDTFNYTVMDLDGAVSNEVTVKVNVIR